MQTAAKSPVVASPKGKVRLGTIRPAARLPFAHRPHGSPSPPATAQAVSAGKTAGSASKKRRVDKPEDEEPKVTTAAAGVAGRAYGARFPA